MTRARAAKPVQRPDASRKRGGIPSAAGERYGVKRPSFARRIVRSGSLLQRTSHWGRSRSRRTRSINPVVFVASVSKTALARIPVSFSNSARIVRLKTGSRDVYTTTSGRDALRNIRKKTAAKRATARRTVRVLMPSARRASSGLDRRAPRPDRSA